jgi:rsbT antagonist protein RsbS
MSINADIPGVAIQVSRNAVVASIQVDLEPDVLARFRDDLLRRLHEVGTPGVILDVSGLGTIDSEEFADLRRIIRMTTIMGAECVLVGLRPGVVSALIDAGADVDGLRTAIDLDAAFLLLQPVPESPCDPAPDGEETVETDADASPDADVSPDAGQEPG